MRIVTIFISLLFISAIQAEMSATSPRSHPSGICGTSDLWGIDPESFLEELKSDNPAGFKKLQEQAAIADAFNALQTQQRIFHAYNFNTQSFYTVTATLRREGTISRIWVEDSSWDNQYVTDPLLDNLLASLEMNSGANSIDPSKGIVEIDTMLFGQPPNYDGDGIVDFLVLDIKDGYSPDQNNEFVAGYFSPTDQTNLPNSNKMDLMYLDSYPGFYDGQNYRTDPVLSTTAHEFQHLIQYHYDPNEDEWVNEGLSQLAGTYCGYGIDFPSLFLQNPNRNLTVWEQKLEDYSRVNLWTLYCAEQLGLTFIKRLTQNPSNGITGFNESLQLAGIPTTLNDVFRSWTLANLINNRSVDPRYGYMISEAAGLRVSITRLITEYPDVVTGIVKRLGAEYHRFRGSDSLQFTFTGMVPSNYWIISRNSMYSIDTILESTTTVPGFSPDSSYILLLYSTTQDISYRYESFATYSLRYFDIAYDDNQADVIVSFNSGNLPAIAANRFTVPESNLDLESVSFYTGAADYTARLRILGNTGSQLPGSDLISPVNVTPTSQGSWVSVDLPEKLTGLVVNQVIYVAVEINEAEKSLGYDDTALNGISYLKLGTNPWSLLSRYSFGNDQPATGLWMIRATFTGLTASDSIPSVEIPENIVVLNNFPNPFFATSGNAMTGTHFSFQIKNPGYLHIEIYDVLGRKVHEISRQVAPIQYAEPSSSNTIFWNGKIKGVPVAAGLYLYRLVLQDAITGSRNESPFQKLIILN